MKKLWGGKRNAREEENERQNCIKGEGMKGRKEEGKTH